MVRRSASRLSQWVPEIAHEPCDLRIFVEQAAEAVVRDDRGIGVNGCGWEGRSGAAWLRAR